MKPVAENSAVCVMHGRLHQAGTKCPDCIAGDAELRRIDPEWLELRRRLREADRTVYLPEQVPHERR